MTNQPTAKRPARERHPKSETRWKILQRAYEMYLDGQLTPGDERLSLVLESLGYTTGAGYQIWSSQADFRVELQRYIAENTEPKLYGSDPVVALADVSKQSDNWTTALLHIGEFLHHSWNDETFYMMLRFYSMGDTRSDDITRAIRDQRDYARSAVAAIIEMTMARFDRQFATDHTLADTTRSVIQILDGGALAHRVEQPKPTPDGHPRPARDVADVIDAHTTES